MLERQPTVSAKTRLSKLASNLREIGEIGTA